MNRATHYISILGTSNGPFYHQAFIIIFPLFCQAAANKRKRSERSGVQEERADHVFPLLTSTLWHVHTWFSLECCFSGIAVGTTGRLAVSTGDRSKCSHRLRETASSFSHTCRERQSCKKGDEQTSFQWRVAGWAKFKPDEICFTSRQRGQRRERKMLYVPQQLLLHPPPQKKTQKHTLLTLFLSAQLLCYFKLVSADTF